MNLIRNELDLYHIHISVDDFFLKIQLFKHKDLQKVLPKLISFKFPTKKLDCFHKMFIIKCRGILMVVVLNQI